jgi:hypothetical protein
MNDTVWLLRSLFLKGKELVGEMRATLSESVLFFDRLALAVPPYWF